MAVLYISEFHDVALMNGLPQIAQTPPAAQQTVAIGGASVQSAAFNALTRFVRVHTDAICSIRFGSNPTVVATDARLAANQTEYFGVNPGDKIAVISNS